MFFKDTALEVAEGSAAPGWRSSNRRTTTIYLYCKVYVYHKAICVNGCVETGT